MLDRETNQLLTSVEGDAPMGQLLRRYWHPIAGVAELEHTSTKPVELFGERLVLFKDLSGTLGLIARACPHRGADLSLGIPEQRGLRCIYHGWQYDHDGACLAQPFEDTVRPDGNFRSKCRTRAYPVRAHGGMIWAYLGPAPVPCLPDWDFFSSGAHRLIWINTVACNWLQCHENSLDPIHFEWLHDYATWARTHRTPGADGSVKPQFRKHVKLAFEEFEWGFIYRRLREGVAESDPDWATGRVSLFPNAFYAGGVLWSVPINDRSTLLVGLSLFRMPDGQRANQPSIPVWHQPEARLQYEQDLMVFTGQGTIADRSAEHLGESDRGIIMLRRRLMSELEAVQQGRDPKGVVRDPARNQAIPLPDATFMPVPVLKDDAGLERVLAGFPPEMLPEHLRDLA